MGHLDNLYIFCVGPILGGFLGALFYKRVLSDDDNAGTNRA
jgi:glycerol uptake facilitator-like aquaporin